MGELILLRHGETEWSLAGKHTGRTDIPLTTRGEAAAKALAPLVARRDIVAVFTSPARRAVTTAALRRPGQRQARSRPVGMGLRRLRRADHAADPGDEARLVPVARRRDPGDAEHPGETIEQVAERVDRVLARVRPLLADGDVALVAHGHVLRVLTARYLRLPPADGRLFRLDTGTVSTLGTEHDEPVIASWNVPPSP